MLRSRVYRSSGWFTDHSQTWRVCNDLLWFDKLYCCSYDSFRRLQHAITIHLHCIYVTLSRKSQYTTFHDFTLLTGDVVIFYVFNFLFNFVKSIYNIKILCCKNVTDWGYVGHGRSSNIALPDELKQEAKPKTIIVSRSHAGDVKSLVETSLGKDTVVEPAGGAGKLPLISFCHLILV